MALLLFEVYQGNYKKISSQVILTKYDIIQLFVSSSLLSAPLTFLTCVLTCHSVVIITLATYVETLKNFDFLGKYTHTSILVQLCKL